MPSNSTDNRHPEADTTMVSVERSDVIDAVAGLLLMARENRKAAKLRQNGGPGNSHHRAWLRSTADTYESAASRMQRVADES